jgi:ubiquinone biosynthesis protein COQ9
VTSRKPRSKKPPDDAELRRAVFEAALSRLAQDGFTEKTLNHAAAAANVDAATLNRLFSGGRQNLAEAFSEWADEQMDAALRKTPLSEMKIRERIKAAVNARIVALRPHKEAARRAAAFLSLPQNAALAATLLWRTADHMWRAAGDTSTDFNFYTKRAILMGVYSSTMLRWFTDDGEDEKDTFEFLDARIGNVMQFEKFKAEVNEHLSKLPSLGKVLSRFSGSSCAPAGFPTCRKDVARRRAPPAPPSRALPRL